MAQAHTPAPWLVGEDQCVDECWSIVTTTGGAIIANVNDKAARKANARLIAAAPDLLEALIEAQIALDLAKCTFSEFGVIRPQVNIALAQVIAAIAKAKGGAA